MEQLKTKGKMYMNANIVSKTSKVTNSNIMNLSVSIDQRDNPQFFLFRLRIVRI